MYERFTDRARKVMQLANQEAQRFNHEYIGTEHILLGLIKEGSGVAANVLKNLGVDLRKNPAVKSRSSSKRARQGHDGQAPPDAPGQAGHRILRWKRLETSATITSAPSTSCWDCSASEEGVAAQVLMNLGVNLEKARQEVLNLLGPGLELPQRDDRLAASRVSVSVVELSQTASPDAVAPAEKGFTDRARIVLQLANQEAQRFNHEYIGTEHILLGLVHEGSGVAANVLKNMGIDLHKTRLEVEKARPERARQGHRRPVPPDAPDEEGHPILDRGGSKPRPQLRRHRTYFTGIASRAGGHSRPSADEPGHES